MLTIDGSFGEGGGQILRTALALSLVTGKPFQISDIRAGRKKPGLMRQHLTSVNAAAEIGNAEIYGNAIGSSELTFVPGTITPGNYRFSVGTAGSCTLVLQTVLPALLTASAPSELILEGGTHNPFAPSFDFLNHAYLPLIHRMGPKVTASLDRPGYYPAGGGRFRVFIQPSSNLQPLDLMTRGEIIGRKALARVSKLPMNIAHRELKVIRDRLSWHRENLVAESVEDSHGPGNILTLMLAGENVTEVFTGFGTRGIPAEIVAEKAAGRLRTYLRSEACVGKYLADQLLLPMAVSGRGRFTTLSPTLHTRTNAEIIRQFLDVKIHISQKTESMWMVHLNQEEIE